MTQFLEIRIPGLVSGSVHAMALGHSRCCHSVQQAMQIGVLIQRGLSSEIGHYGCIPVDWRTYTTAFRSRVSLGNSRSVMWFLAVLFHANGPKQQFPQQCDDLCSIAK